jgi:hypothetical protein
LKLKIIFQIFANDRHGWPRAMHITASGTCGDFVQLTEGFLAFLKDAQAGPYFCLTLSDHWRSMPQFGWLGSCSVADTFSIKLRVRTTAVWHFAASASSGNIVNKASAIDNFIFIFTSCK